MAPNEAGKSTIFRALETVFFERHTTAAKLVKELTPHRGGSPLIEADFDIAGVSWRITKVFGRGKKAALRARLKAAADAQYAAQVNAEYLREAAPKAAPGNPPAKDAASKEPSAAEMEAFLLERVPVGEEELRALDARRSERVKTYLVGTGQLPADRVLIAVATSPAADKPQASRVDFALK